jgi:hypothetical protein
LLAISADCEQPAVIGSRQCSCCDRPDAAKLPSSDRRHKIDERAHDMGMALAGLT